MIRLLRRAAFLAWVVLQTLARGRRPVLFVRQGALGDILCTFPAAHELKKRHPGALCVYSCLPDFASLPRLAGLTTHVTSVFIAPQSRWRRLFAAVYHFSYAAERDQASTASLTEEFCREHGLPPDGPPPPLEAGPDARARVGRILAQHGLREGSLVLLHPGPSWPVKEWPAEKWAALVQLLRQAGHEQIVQVGVSKHVEMGARVERAIPGAISLENQLTVEETVALIAMSRLLIGIDSGPLHIAAAVSVPSVGLFGPTSPRFIFSSAPLGTFIVSRIACQGCHHRVPRLHWKTGCPYDIACMKQIEAGEVAQAAVARLGAAKSSSSPQP